MSCRALAMAMCPFSGKVESWFEPIATKKRLKKLCAGQPGDFFVAKQQELHASFELVFIPRPATCVHTDTATRPGVASHHSRVRSSCHVVLGGNSFPFHAWEKCRPVHSALPGDTMGPSSTPTGTVMPLP